LRSQPAVQQSDAVSAETNRALSMMEMFMVLFLASRSMGRDGFTRDTKCPRITLLG
jgi:hypothetical protein